MQDILKTIIDNPATAYLLSYGGLGLVLNLALNWAHKQFTMTDRMAGLATLASGAVGGLLLQETGLVNLPGDHNFMSYALAAFVGGVTAAAAASFSAIDLRATMTKAKE